MAQPARNIDNLPPEILATCMAQASGGDYDRLCVIGNASPAFRRGFELVLGALKAVSLRITTTPVPAWPRTRNGVALPEPPQPVYEVIKCSVQLASNCLQTLKSVTCLDLTPAGPFLTDDHLALVSKLQGITSLRLAHCRVSEQGLSHLLQLPALQALDLSYAYGFNYEMEILQRLPALTDLSLRGQTFMRDETIMALAPRLRSLDAYDTSLSDGICSQLANCTFLNIVEGFITDSGFMSLAENAPKLQRLVICGPLEGGPAGTGYCTQQCVETFMHRRPDVSVLFQKGPPEVADMVEYDRADEYYYLPEELEMRDDV